MFKVGERIICIRMESDPTMIGLEFTVSEIIQQGDVRPDVTGHIYRSSSPGYGVRLWEKENRPGHIAFCASRFRPLAKRSDTLTIESFLTIKPGFEEPKRRVVEPVKEGQAA